MIDMVILWVVLIIFALAMLGLCVLIDRLIKKLKRLDQPSVKPVKTKDLELIEEKLRSFNLDQRLLLIEMILGNCQVSLTLEHGKIHITGVGSINVEDSNEAIEYAG